VYDVTIIIIIKSDHDDALNSQRHQHAFSYLSSLPQGRPKWSMACRTSCNGSLCFSSWIDSRLLYDTNCLGTSTASLIITTNA
jgi:hypothetical protein